MATKQTATRPEQGPQENMSEGIGVKQQLSQGLRRGLMTFVLTLVLWLGVAAGGPMVSSLPGSLSPALAFSNQQQMVMEVWRIVNRSYVDETFNHKNWWFMRQKVLREQLPDWESTYAAIQNMLAELADPYTRFLPPKQYQSLQTNSNGELLGVGLQIA